MKNILLLNAGTRNILVRDFMKTANGKCNVVVTDNYTLAPALYETPHRYVTQRWDEDGYWDEITQICRDEEIGLIVSLVDPELEMLAGRNERFQEMGILVNTADKKVIRKAYDKAETLEFIRENGFAWIPTFTDYDSAEKAVAEGILHYPLITKPRRGSGSAGIEMVSNPERLKEVCRANSSLLIQEHMKGQEIGADLYTDLISHEVVSVFTKRKLKMRAGETDKSVSFRDEKLFSLLADFAAAFGLRGANDIDLFEQDGNFYISEVNPRFGGGYIHAYAAGVDFPKFLMNNMNGIVNRTEIGSYEEGLYMMKYFDIEVRRKGSLL